MNVENVRAAVSLGEWMESMKVNYRIKKILDNGKGLRIFETRLNPSACMGFLYALEPIYHIWDGNEWITSTSIKSSAFAIFRTRIENQEMLRRGFRRKRTV